MFCAEAGRRSGQVEAGAALARRTTHSGAVETAHHADGGQLIGLMIVVLKLLLVSVAVLRAAAPLHVRMGKCGGAAGFVVQRHRGRGRAGDNTAR